MKEGVFFVFTSVAVHPYPGLPPEAGEGVRIRPNLSIKAIDAVLRSNYIDRQFS